MSDIVDIISLGAGVQSSCMALMAANGELPMPKAAIFADTQGEPKSVYDWLGWLEKQLPFPVHKVTKGNLESDVGKVKLSKKSGNNYLKGIIPAFTIDESGKKGILGRTCTMDYKVAVLIKKTRQLCDWKRGEKRKLVKVWIGISIDEAHRMKPSREAWIENAWPLIDLKMSRKDCLGWMKKNGFPEPPRSACVFCPFHSDTEWNRLKIQEPQEFQRAVLLERKLQDSKKNVPRLNGVPFLHSSCRPLSECDFSPKLPSHQIVDLFGNECEGLCGV